MAIRVIESAARSARVYVPAVMATRGLSFVRVLVVAHVLGAAGQGEFGRYQLALEMVNVLVPLVMLGLGDVAERYISRHEGEGAAWGFAKRTGLRLMASCAVVGALLAAGAPMVGGYLYPEGSGAGIVVVSAAVVAGLAAYQFVLAVLRGLRAYGAAAGMEVASAVLLLGLSAVGAWVGGAATLLGAYLVSVVVPVLYWGGKTVVRLRGAAAGGGGEAGYEGMTGFARWAQARLVLTMVFGFVSVWAVGRLAGDQGGAEAMAAYAMPYRIAQLLAFLGVTVWSSSYGIAAARWAAGGHRAAQVVLLRTGAVGAAGLLGLVLVMVLGRGVVAALTPAVYAEAVVVLLPPLAGVFLWYSLVGLLAMLGDLQERPWVGVVLWGVAVLGQVVFLVLGDGGDAAMRVVQASAGGLAVALFGVAPALLWRPRRMMATAVRIGVVGLAGIACFAPEWIVSWVVVPVGVGVLGFLMATGMVRVRGG